MARLAQKYKPYKSKYEYRQAKRLEENEIYFEYEPCKISFIDGITNGICDNCGSSDVGVNRIYTPDFWFPKSALYIETKGKFTSDNRRKILAIATQNDIDIRMVFMRDNWLTRKHVVKYSTWCEKNNIQYAIGDIPLEWVLRDKK